jgi:hypothetical protein
MTNAPIRKVRYIPTTELKPDPRNPRTHGRAQTQAIAKSIKAFGFTAPILVDKGGRVLAGHGRLEAAKLLELAQVPVIYLENLTEAQAKAYMLADNKLTDRSSWDDDLLAIHLKELAEIVLDFDIEATGFELPEIDFRIQSLDPSEDGDEADEFCVADGPAISLPGDLWHLDQHRLYCGSALDSVAYEVMLAEEKAAAIFTDPPYNVKIDGHVSGNGETKHREFAMASGEMTEVEFTGFLAKTFGFAAMHSRPGALIYTCMDWRHLSEILAATGTNGFDLLNLCVWVKTNGGMGPCTAPDTSWSPCFAMDQCPIATMSSSAGSAATARTCGTTLGPTASPGRVGGMGSTSTPQ